MTNHITGGVLPADELQKMLSILDKNDNIRKGQIDPNAPGMQVALKNLEREYCRQFRRDLLGLCDSPMFPFKKMF